MKKCEYCGAEFEPKRRQQRFCQAACRAAWHKEQSCPGTISSVRQLKSGIFSVAVHFPSRPSLHAGSRCRLESE